MSVEKSASKDVFANSYFSFIRTAHWLEMELKKVLKPMGLTHAQLNVLHILAQAHRKPLTASQIKEKLIVASPDLTRMMDRLEQKGWVKRKSSESNRRQVEHAITDHGRKTFKQAHRACRRAAKNFFAEAINDAEALQLQKIMQKIRS